MLGCRNRTLLLLGMLSEAGTELQLFGSLWVIVPIES